MDIPKIKNKCIDCNTDICKKAKRCTSCANIHRGSWGNHSEEAKLKVSLANKGRIKTPEERKKLSIARKGKTGIFNQTKENKEKHSEFMKEWHKTHKHPKGFLGKKRTNKYLEKASIRFSGEKNPNWQGGINEKEYDKTFNNRFKQAIRKRDNQVCMLCLIHREKLNRALSVHHINYDKLLSVPQNCISLCDCCHGKTGQNRKHWINLFQNLLSEKYGYQYSKNEIVLEVCHEYPAD